MKKLVLLSAIIATLLFSVSHIFAQSQLYSGVWGIRSNASVAVGGRVLDIERDPVIIDGRMVVPARTVFEKLNARVDWYEPRSLVSVVKGTSVIVMYIGDRRAYVNGIEKEMEAPPILVNGTVMVPIRFVAETLDERIGWDGTNGIAFIGEMPSLSSRGGSTPVNLKNRVVVVDAGHGGRQSGAAYGGVAEKNLNLDIAKRLYNMLKELGIKTYMTRYDDSTVGLYTRSRLANRVGADLLVSVHNNAGHSRYSGSMTLYYPSSSKTKGNLSSYEFARIVQKHMSDTLGTKDLGTFARPELAVLRTSNMPAVIAEVGYMTNSSELQKLKSPWYRNRAAEALRDAVVESLDKMY